MLEVLWAHLLVNLWELVSDFELGMVSANLWVYLLDLSKETELDYQLDLSKETELDYPSDLSKETGLGYQSEIVMETKMGQTLEG